MSQKEVFETVNNPHDSTVGSVDDEEDFVGKIALSQEENYDFDYWPKSDGPDGMDGFNFKSKDDDFANAVDKVLELINVKDRELSVEGVTFTCKKYVKTKCMTILDVLGQKVQIQLFTGKKKGTTFQIQKGSGATATHVKLIYKATKFLMFDVPICVSI